MNSSSTLVATVSINYEDFTEGFLTCGTCLCGYDQNEHSPKLLSCSHTICQSCLELIANSPTLNNSTEAGCIKCPICRQNITIPQGGVGALPPSFLVNQLYDLVNKKPREFIPKCSVHIEQELLFCETCDCVFCDTCNKSNDDSDPSSSPITNNPNLSSVNSADRTIPVSSSSSNASTTSSSSNTTTNSLTFSSNNYSANNSRQLQQQQKSQTKQHINEVCTVIPFSTAIKRMSEILNYRSQQCLNKLNEARDNVQREVNRLESNSNDAIRDIELAFEKIKEFVNEREKALLEETKKLQIYKEAILTEQLNTIESEKSSLNTNNSVKINNETDVKNLSKKISDLTEKNDIALALFTPRENCFICFENNNLQSSLGKIQDSIDNFGNIRTSKTYPPHCTSKIEQCSTNLRSFAIVQSIDYDGNSQTFGGDPIMAELRLVLGPNNHQDINGEIEITDKHNGTYEVAFVPPTAGRYQLSIYIFNRPIKNSPLEFETNSHHNPVAIFGRSSKRGLQDQFDSFSQPASLAINKHNGRVYIIDSHNSRIKVLAQIDSQQCPFSFMQHIQPEFFTRSCTGIALLYPGEINADPEDVIQNLSLSPSKQQNPNILVTDWRNHAIYEMNNDGKLIRQITHDELTEPTNIVVDSRGRILVVNREFILVFSSSGKLLLKLTGYKYDENDESSFDQDSIKKSTDSHSVDAKLQAEDIVIGSTQQSTILHNLDGGGDATNKKPNNNNNISANNINLIAHGQEKRAAVNNVKTGTLSSLMSMKRKPKILPGSSLQRGSKAVISAAHKIRSTFTLSHSTSLVSAVSLQSMFNHNNNKQQDTPININNNNQQQLDSQSVNTQFNVGNNKHKYANKHQGAATNDNNGNSITGRQHIHHHNGAMINNDAHNNHYQLHKGDELNTNAADDDHGSIFTKANDQSNAKDGKIVEPFGIIRGIAIGPEDELIVADESRIRVLIPKVSSTGAAEELDYVVKRDLKIYPSSTGNSTRINHISLSVDKLFGVTYDNFSKKLLILFTNFNSGTPYIQIVDYTSGEAKFIIDSYESKLIRPSCLATYGEYVIVTDLGNDCIKKYRFY